LWLLKVIIGMLIIGEVTVNFDTKSAPKTMDVTVGDNTYHLISYDANASWAKDLEPFTGNYYATTLNTSYTLVIEQGKLVLIHPRLEPIELSPRIPNLFTGNQGLN